MCGIAGYIGSRQNFPKKNDINDCLKIMQLRRGPDSADQRIVDKEDYSLVFLHSRLSIIDPNPRSKQPMEDSEGILSFSGEIYNYLEIKSDLIKLGHKFKTKSDTEVILNAYKQWGFESFHKFNGMFVFAIWDSAKRELIIARDRYGVKPLVYYWDGRTFIFCIGGG